MATNDNRGGRRPGAGRKPVGLQAALPVTLRLSEETRDELRAFIAKHRMLYDTFVTEALLLMKARYGDD